jgi:hypothetical protein
MQALDWGWKNSVAAAQAIVHVVAMQHISPGNRGIVRMIRSLISGHFTLA